MPNSGIRLLMWWKGRVIIADDANSQAGHNVYYGPSPPAFLHSFTLYCRCQMEINRVPFTNTVWVDQPVTESKGETGISFSRTVQNGNISVRMVEFSPGYRADHWCARGHIVLVLEGTLITELEDGRTFLTTVGNSFQVGDQDGRHRVCTQLGAKVFIVD
ncbi:MAG: DHCW motif cupin fold protein [Acidobacteriaceae bacterium]